MLILESYKKVNKSEFINTLKELFSNKNRSHSMPTHQAKIQMVTNLHFRYLTPVVPHLTDNAQYKPCTNQHENTKG